MKLLLLFCLSFFILSFAEIEGSEDISSNISIQKEQLALTLKNESQELVVYKSLFAFFFVLAIIFLGLFLLYRKKFIDYKESHFLVDQEHMKKNSNIENKEKLISYVSHELRTPMTAITGLIHLMLESNLNRVQEDYLKKIEKASDYMLSLLNDILDLSKIEADKLKLEQSEFNLNDIVNYIYNVVSVQAKNNNLHIVVRMENSVPSQLIGDSLRLGQVLINLMGNAIKFTKEGKITLSVKKLDNVGDKVHLEFSVSDTGIGMTQQQLKGLFASYYQAEDSTSREYGGTGLGLNISKSLVEMMGGKIAVESKKGFGTTFKFVLAFALKNSNEKRQYRLPSEKFLSKRVLLVDSGNTNAIPLIKALNYFKYKIHNIPAFDKIECESQEKYDIVIINLQNLNESAIEKIKSMQSKDGAKVVILSQLYSTLNPKILNELVVDAYLKPPITLQNTLNLIIELYHKPNIALTRKNILIEELKKYEGKKILVVEDDELNYKVIAGMLAKTNVETHYAENGQKAVELLNENIHFDLILMDINMPLMNGYETSLKIRQNKLLDNMPIVALSADTSEESKNKAKECGMQAYLLKPIKLNEFYSKIIELFENQKV